jgi:hypothetical protein
MILLRWLAYLYIGLRVGMLAIGVFYWLWTALSPASNLSAWKRLLNATLGISALALLIYLFSHPN